MDQKFRLTFRGKQYIASSDGDDHLQILLSCSGSENAPQLSMSTHGGLDEKDKIMRQSLWLIESLEAGDSITIEFDNSAEPTKPYQTTNTGPLIEHCTFCGKSKNEVDILIQGSKFLRGHICNKCVTDCGRLINEERKQRRKSS